MYSPKILLNRLLLTQYHIIDSFLENGSTKEEQKNHDEVKKILDNKISITSTCVRIPVLVSHSISVNGEI
jgi:Aspartate-semialdehyde dehydrogenase